MTRRAGMARTLHLILDAVLRFRVVLGEGSSETAGADWSNDGSRAGRGEGGGVNMW
jgi:hypothetical protein